MLELRHILVDLLPRQERHYLEENLKGEAVQTIYLDGLTETLQVQLFAFLPEECILISGNQTHLDAAICKGMAALGYLPQEKLSQDTHQPSESHLSPDMYTEGMEEIDFRFLLRVYQRHHNLPWTILETRRCIVKEFSMEYLEDLYELYAGDGMTDFIEPLYPYEQELEYQQSYLKYMYRFYGYGMWIVLEKETGKLIGRAGFENKEELGEEVQMGYAIGVPYQRQGYATEVCRALLDYARDELEILSICCLIQAENEKSIGLVRKLGFELAETINLNGKSHRKFVSVL